jgi:hypothetical protein
MQSSIMRATPMMIEYIVKEVEPKFSELLIDQYGNYFCQKLFMKLNDEQKERLLKSLA